MSPLPLQLAPARCFVDRRYSDKAACLGDLATRAAAMLDIDRGVILSELKQREALGSTGLGAGIALPHARIANLVEPFLMLATLREPINFEAIDEKPVDLVCLLLLPPEPGSAHLRILSCCSRMLRDKTTAAAIRHARSSESLAAIVNGDVDLSRASPA